MTIRRSRLMLRASRLIDRWSPYGQTKAFQVPRWGVGFHASALRCDSEFIPHRSSSFPYRDDDVLQMRRFRALLLSGDRNAFSSARRNATPRTGNRAVKGRGRTLFPRVFVTGEPLRPPAIFRAFPPGRARKTQGFARTFYVPRMTRRLAYALCMQQIE